MYSNCCTIPFLSEQAENTPTYREVYYPLLDCSKSPEGEGYHPLEETQIKPLTLSQETHPYCLIDLDCPLKVHLKYHHIVYRIPT